MSQKTTEPDTEEAHPVADALGMLHRELTVIEVTDATDLTSLLSDARVAELVLARIGSTAAVVEPRNVPKLLTALQKSGHTPTVLGS